MIRRGKLHGEIKSIGALIGTLKSKVKLHGIIREKESLRGELRELSYSTKDYASESDIDELFEEVQ